MKIHLRTCIAWALLLISSFSAFSATAFSDSSDAEDSHSSVVLQEGFFNQHLPVVQSTPFQIRIGNSLLEAFDLEEETESDTDDRKAAAKGKSDTDDHKEVISDKFTEAEPFLRLAYTPFKEILPAGFSSAIPVARSLYLIFRVFRI